MGHLYLPMAHIWAMTDLGLVLFLSGLEVGGCYFNLLRNTTYIIFTKKILINDARSAIRMAIRKPSRHVTFVTVVTTNPNYVSTASSHGMLIVPSYSV